MTGIFLSFLQLYINYVEINMCIYIHSYIYIYIHTCGNDIDPCLFLSVQGSIYGCGKKPIDVGPGASSGVDP